MCGRRGEILVPTATMDAWALFDVRYRGFWLLECQCNTGESERHSQSLAHAKWFSEHDGGSDDANDWHRKRANGGGRRRNTPQRSEPRQIAECHRAAHHVNKPNPTLSRNSAQ